MYRSADGVWITMVASSDAIFVRLCRAMGAPAMATDPRYATQLARLGHLAELDDAIAGWFARTPAAEALAACEREGVAAARVNDVAAVEREPQFLARGAIVRLPDPELGTVPAPCAVPRMMGAAPLPPPRTGPGVGEHNDAVWGGLGLDRAALDALRRDGVI
jgi:crotonobetainyl-CoA:carnitine CoA-transferase CaiB-like acyl-CoA transferase